MIVEDVSWTDRHARKKTYQCIDVFWLSNLTFGTVESRDSLAQQAVEVREFFLDTTAVTNEQFRAFRKATSYQTESQSFGWSFVLELHATEEAKANKVAAQAAKQQGGKGAAGPPAEIELGARAPVEVAAQTRKWFRSG